VEVESADTSAEEDRDLAWGLSLSRIEVERVRNERVLAEQEASSPPRAEEYPPFEFGIRVSRQDGTEISTVKISLKSGEVFRVGRHSVFHLVLDDINISSIHLEMRLITADGEPLMNPSGEEALLGIRDISEHGTGLQESNFEVKWLTKDMYVKVSDGCIVVLPMDYLPETNQSWSTLISIHFGSESMLEEALVLRSVEVDAASEEKASEKVFDSDDDAKSAASEKDRGRRRRGH